MPFPGLSIRKPLHCLNPISCGPAHSPGGPCAEFIHPSTLQSPALMALLPGRYFGDRGTNGGERKEGDTDRLQQGTGLFGNLELGSKKLARQGEGLLSGTSVCHKRPPGELWNRSTLWLWKPVLWRAQSFPSQQRGRERMGSDSAGIRNPSSTKHSGRFQTLKRQAEVPALKRYGVEPTCRYSYTRNTGCPA